MAEKTAVPGFPWRRFFIKELLIFSLILLALAMLWHPDLLTDPLHRLERLSKSSMVSPWHPFFWSLGIYGFAGVIRLLLALVKKLQR